MPEPYELEFNVAIQAVRAAARICQSVQTKVSGEVLQKQDRSPVTVADFCSQAIICRSIALSFPNDPIVAEEAAMELERPENSAFMDRIAAELLSQGVQGSHDEIRGWIDRGASLESSDRFWTLDPVDGTKGFLRGEQYAISLTLLEQGQIRMSVLGCPNLSRSSDLSRGTVFYARQGQGSFVSQPFGTSMSAERIRVTDMAEPRDLRVCESVESAHSSHSRSAQLAAQLGITNSPIRLDSQAKYGVVARGDAELYLRLPTKVEYTEKIWDHAGGVLIVEEAGGRVSDIDGNHLQFTKGRELSANRGVVVSNGVIHEKVLEALRDIGTD